MVEVIIDIPRVIRNGLHPSRTSSYPPLADKYGKCRMAIIQLKSKSGRLTPYGKKEVAHAWFCRGANFLLAAKLLEKKGRSRYVFLHLLCQGLEIIIKALLLMQNYDTYKPKLISESKGGLGHDLVKCYEELRKELDNKPLRKKDKNIMSELKILNNFYKKHILRYGNLLDFFGEATISSDLVRRYAFKLVRFGNRKFRIKKPTNR